MAVPEVFLEVNPPSCRLPSSSTNLPITVFPHRNKIQTPLTIPAR